MSDLGDFFSSINTNAIAAFIDERRQEDLHLDFKTVSDDRRLAREDIRNLSKAISGFANSAGGIIIWGVEARKGAEDVDCAQQLVPVRNVARVLGDFQSLTGQATDPAVEGILHEMLGESDKGEYIKTFVPPSEFPPHMAIQGGLHDYYKRSGDSFYRMEHHDIADLFGTRRGPKLALCATNRSIESTEGRIERYSVAVGLKNHGRGMARFPCLELQVNRPYFVSEYGLDGNRTTGLRKRPVSAERREDRVWLFGGGADDVVHVGSVLEITRIEWERGDWRGDAPELHVRYRISALDMSPVEAEARIIGEEVRPITPENGT